MKEKIRLIITVFIYLIFNIIIIDVIVYFANLLIVSNSITDIMSQKVNDNGIITTIFSVKTYLSYFNLVKILSFSEPLRSGIYIIGYLLNILTAFLFIGTQISRLLKVKKTYDVDNKYGSHGTAEWIGSESIDEIYKENDKVGWFFGTDESMEYKLDETLNNPHYIYHSVNNKKKLNMQCIVIGPPGSNKTTGFVLPNLLHIPKAYQNEGLELPDVVCIDPAPELLPMTYKYYKDLDYEVKIIDYVFQKYGDSFNNLQHLEREKDIFSFAGEYINAYQKKSSQGSSSGEYFVNGAKNLLAAGISYVLQKYPKDKQNMTGVMQFIHSKEVQDPELAVDFFENEGITGAARNYWNNFISVANSPETYSSVVSSLTTYLSVFSFKETQNQILTDSAGISMIGKKTISEKEAAERRKKLNEDIESCRVKMQESRKFIESRANLLIDRVEKFYECEYIERSNYEQIIENNMRRFDGEMINYLSDLSEIEDKNSKQASKIQNMIEQYSNFSENFRLYEKRKSKVERLQRIYETRIDKIEKEVAEIKTKPIILYILIPEDDESMEPLINTTVNTVLRQLYATAKKTKDLTLEVPVYLFLEEFNNIGRLPGIEKKLGTMRKKKIYPMIIVQSLAQFKSKYQEDWENMMSQCDTLIVLGVNDLFTAGQISDMLGSQTIKIQGNSDQHMSSILNDLSQLSEQYHGRELLKKDEVKSLDNERIVVIPRASKPMLLYKAQFKYWENGWKEDMYTNIHSLKQLNN